MPSLGCSDYTVLVTERGGRVPVIAALPWTSLEWTRVIDGISDAEVIIAGLQGDALANCCGQLSAVEPWAHDLVIFRNGEKVWEGPITFKSYRADGIGLQARDVMAWTERRRIHNDLSHTTVDLSDIFEDYLRDAMSVDNSALMTWSIAPCGQSGDRRVLAAQYVQAWSALEELANTAVDFTVIGRQVVVGGFEMDFTPIGTFTDQSFVDVDVLEVQGNKLATDVVVIGDGFGEAGATIVGQYTGGDSSRYGVHEQTYTEAAIRDNQSAGRAARTRQELNASPLHVLGGGNLDPSCPVDVNDILPGRAVRIALGTICEPVVGLYRISKVVGSFGPEHDRIGVTMTPIGTSLYTQSTAVVATVPCPAPTMTLHPLDVAVDEGDNAVFTAAGTNVVSANWQFSIDDGATWSDTGETDPNTFTWLAAAAGDDGVRIRVVYTNACGVIYSRRATLTVITAVELALTPVSATVSTVALTVTPGAASIALTPETVTISTVDVSITSGISIPLTPQSITVSPQTLTVSTGEVQIALTPETVTVSAIALTVLAGSEITLTPQTLTVSTVDVAISAGAVSIALSPETLTISTVALFVSQEIALTPQTITITVIDVTPSTTGGVGLAPNEALIDLESLDHSIGLVYYGGVKVMLGEVIEGTVVEGV